MDSLLQAGISLLLFANLYELHGVDGWEPRGGDARLCGFGRDAGWRDEHGQRRNGGNRRRLQLRDFTDTDAGHGDDQLHLYLMIN